MNSAYDTPTEGVKVCAVGCDTMTTLGRTHLSMSVEEFNVIVRALVRVAPAAQDIGAHASIANSEAAEVEWSGISQDLAHDGRDVDAGVTLAQDVEIVLGELGEVVREEGREELVVGLGDERVVPVAARVAVALGSGVGALAAVAVRVPDGWRVVDGDDIGDLGPSVRVVLHLRDAGLIVLRVVQGVLVQVVRAELNEHAKHGVSARTAVVPHDHGVVRWVVLGLNEDVVEVHRALTIRRGAGVGETAVRLRQQRPVPPWK